MGIFLSLRADLRNAAHASNGENVNASFRNANLEPLPQWLAARFAPPCKIRVLAMVLMVTKITSAKSVNYSSPDVHTCRVQYTRETVARVRSSVSSRSYRDFADSMGRVFVECQAHCARRAVENALRRPFDP